MSKLAPTDKLILPVIALRELVLFPGTTVPVAAGRPATLRAIEAASSRPDKLIFAVLQRDNVDKVTAQDLHTIGTVARIDQLQRGLAGMQLLLSGVRRGIALRIAERDKHLVATVGAAEELLPTRPDDPAFVALHRELRERAGELGVRSGLPQEAVQQVVTSVEDPGRFADLVAGYLDIEPAQRQSLLETLAIEERLRRVLLQVQKRLSELDAQDDIKSQVQEELGDRQREMFLREQLKAIQRELGDADEGEELDELRAKIDSLDLPPDVKKEVDRELNRLARMGRESMESQVIRTFVETVAELPWNVRSEEQLDIGRAAEILDEDHYALGEVKDRILEFLAVRQLRLRAEEEARDEEARDEEGAADPESTSVAGARSTGDSDPVKGQGTKGQASRGPILLFVGPPGVGKTSLAKSIARATGRKYIRISLGGARDEADIRGHRRTYVAAMPGRIIQGMKQAGTKNPVFLLDEVDKLGASFQGDPAAALLEVLDPAQNDSFTDHYLGIPFDLSEVLFIATANLVQGIPQPLLDRMEMVEFSGYTEGEKLAIAQQYLVPRQLRENGLDDEKLRICADAIARLITGYTREAGVRQLERELGRLARKVARKIASGETRTLELTTDHVGEMLGRPKVHPEHAANESQIGVATGMYFTPVGGDIMFVEVSSMRGKGKLTLTGQLGDVMKESAQAAWTYARSHAEALRIDEEQFDRDLHIHVPAGAVPKDGPSAGVTMGTALVSALAHRPVRHDIAMTGEITLNGRVLPIGGVKEKVLGAVRAGIHQIILPKQNEADLEDLPDEVRRTLRVFPVEHLGEVLAFALPRVSLQGGRLVFDGESPGERPPLSPGLHN